MERVSVEGSRRARPVPDRGGLRPPWRWRLPRRRSRLCVPGRRTPCVGLGERVARSAGAGLVCSACECAHHGARLRVARGVVRYAALYARAGREKLQLSRLGLCWARATPRAVSAAAARPRAAPVSDQLVQAAESRCVRAAVRADRRRGAARWSCRRSKRRPALRARRDARRRSWSEAACGERRARVRERALSRGRAGGRPPTPNSRIPRGAIPGAPRRTRAPGSAAPTRPPRPDGRPRRSARRRRPRPARA